MANTEIRLYCFIFCVVVACCLSPLAVWSRTDKPANIEDAYTFEHLWQGTPADQRRALPNNIAPPERRLPHMQLPPLPPQEEGTIRRVMLPEGTKAVALTFDLCELATTTTGYDADAINFLRREHIPATLFMGGKWMRTHAERAKQLMADPLFEIGNHAWSHGNFGIMDPQNMRDQVLWTQAEYEILRGELLRGAAEKGASLPDIAAVPNLFRLPYGRCTDQALALLAHLGLQVINGMWWLRPLRITAVLNWLRMWHAGCVPVPFFSFMPIACPRAQRPCCQVWCVNYAAEDIIS